MRAVIRCSAGLLVFGVTIAPAADAPPLQVIEVSTDATYGTTEANPIKSGGGFGDGVEREGIYLSFLRGPHGESISSSRDGSCCSFPTPNGVIGGMGLLDVYTVTISGGGTRKLYIDMYDYEAPKAPVGFTVAH